jgi:hypothetical protein
MIEQQPTTHLERWLVGLLVIVAVLGAVWWYSHLWLGRTYFTLPFVLAATLLGGGVWVWLVRARRRGAAAREAQLERKLWQGTLPGDNQETGRRSSDERVI